MEVPHLFATYPTGDASYADAPNVFIHDFICISNNIGVITLQELRHWTQ